MKRRHITAPAAIAVAVILILGGVCRKAAENKGEGSAAAVSSASADKAPAPILFAEVFVNELRAASLTPDLPVIVRAAFDAPEAPTGWTPGDPTGLSLAVKDSAGAGIAVEAERLSGMPLPEGAPARGAAFHWALKTALPPGEYEIGLRVPEGWAGGKDLEIRVESASLKVVEGAADSETRSYWDRRKLMLGGRPADYLKAVDAALAGKPADSRLRLERVEGLVMTGDKAAAARELSKLLYDIQEGQRKSDPGRDPHIPSWLMDYLTSLK